MNLHEKQIYPAVAVITALVSLGQLFVSKQFHTVWGVDAGPATVFMSQRWAAFGLAISWILWNFRHKPETYSTINLAIMVSGLIQVGTVVFLWLNGTLSSGAWVGLVSEGLVTLAFVYLLLTAKSRRGSA